MCALLHQKVGICHSKVITGVVLQFCGMAYVYHWATFSCTCEISLIYVSLGYNRLNICSAATLPLPYVPQWAYPVP